MNKETCGTRIKKALLIRDIKAIDLCNKTGIPKSAMSQYINDRFEPKQDRVYLIAQALEVTEAWLMGYDVPMEREPAKAPSKLDIHIEPSILKKYNALNTIGQCKTDAYVDGLLENEAYRKNNPSEEITYTSELAAFGGASKTDKITKETVNQLVDELEDPID